MTGEYGRVYRFDEFELDADNRQLRRADKVIPLPAKAFDLLLTLIENNGRLVEKEDLFARVWHDQIVEESNITVHISNIRRALGDTSKNPRYVVTVPGYGYRFQGDVSNGGNSQLVIENREFARITIESEIKDESGLSELNDHERQRKSASSSLIRGRWMMAFGFLAVLLTGAGLFWFFSRNPEYLGVAGGLTAENELKIKRLTNQGRVNRARLSPNGRFFAYTLRRRGSFETEFRLGQTDGSSDILLRSETGMSQYPIAFSSDGSWLYYVEMGAISEYKDPKGAFYRMSVLGGAPQKLSDSASVFSCLSPDETQLAFPNNSTGSRASAIIISGLNGSNPREIAAQPPDGFIDVESLSWSADGQFIAFGSSTGKSAADSSSPTYEIFIANVLKNSVERLTHLEWNRVLDTSWLNDGSGLVVVGRDKRQVNTSSLWLVDHPSGTTKRISRDVNRYSGISVSSDSSEMIAVQNEAGSNLWKASADDLAKIDQITFSTSGRQDGWYGFDWTPDGHIVFTAWTDESEAIWAMNADGSNTKQLTSIGFRDEKPSVSSDGRYVVFQTNRSGSIEIWRMDIDGDNLTQLTTSGNNTDPSLTPDGLWIVYRHSSENGDDSLWRVSISGGEPLLITEADAIIPRVSPDGKQIAAVVVSSGQYRLVVFDIESGEALKSFEPPATYNFRYSLRWSPDGQSITFPDEANGIWRQPLSGGDPERLPDLPQDRIFSFGWSRDGKQFAFGRQREVRDVVLLSNFR